MLVPTAENDRRDKHRLSGIRNECNLPEANNDTGSHYSNGQHRPCGRFVPLRGTGRVGTRPYVSAGAPQRCASERGGSIVPSWTVLAVTFFMLTCVSRRTVTGVLSFHGQISACISQFSAGTGPFFSGRRVCLWRHAARSRRDKEPYPNTFHFSNMEPRRPRCP